MAERDLETIRDWLRRGGIRWGMDGDHCAPLGVRPSPNHTWQHGLRRLLLGYAIDRNDTLIGGEAGATDITPCQLDPWGDASGGDYERFGRFHRYCELAFALNDLADETCTPEAWAERLRKALLEPFFAAERRYDPEIGREVSAVSRLIDAFADECRRAAATAPIPFDALRDVLAAHAAKTTRGVPQLRDGVTVAGFATGQVHPAKVVCLLGVNDGTFPSRPAPMPFAFLTKLFGEDHRTIGDRDLGDDDRFAFLEAVLAARQHLILTYTGRDMQEDNGLPASVVVSELTAYLAKRSGIEPERYTTQHPLQPFSPLYFSTGFSTGPSTGLSTGEPSLFSYSQPMLAAAKALVAPADPPARFAREIPAANAPAPAAIDLEDLVRFSANPSKHFLRQALNVHLDLRDDEVADDEPFQLDALQGWQLKSELAAIKAETTQSSSPLAAAGGLLPPSGLGKIQYRQSSVEIQKTLDTLKSRFGGRLENADVDIVIDDVRIVGSVEDFQPDDERILFWRVGRIREKDKIAVWLRLLALACQRAAPLGAVLIGSKTSDKPETIGAVAPAEAEGFLEDWLCAWSDAHRKPVPFFPQTSWATSPSGQANAWSGYLFPGEGDDPYNQLLYPESPSSEKEFKELVEKLLGPLKEALE